MTMNCLPLEQVAEQINRSTSLISQGKMHEAVLYLQEALQQYRVHHLLHPWSNKPERLVVNDEGAMLDAWMAKAFDDQGDSRSATMPGVGGYNRVITIPSGCPNNAGPHQDQEEPATAVAAAIIFDLAMIYQLAALDRSSSNKKQLAASLFAKAVLLYEQCLELSKAHPLTNNDFNTSSNSKCSSTPSFFRLAVLFNIGTCLQSLGREDLANLTTCELVDSFYTLKRGISSGSRSQKNKNMHTQLFAFFEGVVLQLVIVVFSSSSLTAAAAA